MRGGRTLTRLPAYKPRRRVSGPLADRLAAKSQRLPSGCRVWVGSIKPNGYGKIVYEGRNLYTHRAAYELAHGPIPDGMTVDHLCRTRACIDPAHMELVTRGENTRRGATKTHCKQGHALTGANVRMKRRGSYMVRDCKACDADRQRERYRRRIAARG